MATIIPDLNSHTQGRMTSGERRLAEALKKYLERECLVWYDIPISRERRYPDFIILNPSRGLLLLEVKDWKLETIQHITKTSVTLLTENGRVTHPHPLEQVRQYALKVNNLLSRDPSLCQKEGIHQGKLTIPYGYGVVLANITRKQMEAKLSDGERDTLFPDHLTVYKGEFSDSVDPAGFRKNLWSMFSYQFGGSLSDNQIERVRWHLFPEVCINHPRQNELDFSPLDEPESTNPPDIVQIMDLEQELLARNLGDGHRVIHGVAGSGKTMILIYRCRYLANLLNRPILLLCFNITLAARLRAICRSAAAADKIQVHHFHDWCGQQLKAHGVSPTPGREPIYKRQPTALLRAVNSGEIPGGQYGAVLIDEGHDMEPDWFRIIVQMVDQTTNILLLLYDDAQSIYKKKSGIGFSLSSVGIRASGRTKVLTKNYRNTREILEFAYGFASKYIKPVVAADDDHIPLVAPTAIGLSGAWPITHRLADFDQELDVVVSCIHQWRASGFKFSDIAVLYLSHDDQGKPLGLRLNQRGIPCQLLANRDSRLAYDSESDSVALMTIQSSKGLEFECVVMIGIDATKNTDDKRQEYARLLYVGMTRARQHLVITYSSDNDLTKTLEATGRLARDSSVGKPKKDTAVSSGTLPSWSFTLTQ